MCNRGGRRLPRESAMLYVWVPEQFNGARGCRGSLPILLRTTRPSGTLLPAVAQAAAANVCMYNIRAVGFISWYVFVRGRRPTQVKAPRPCACQRPPPTWMGASILMFRQPVLIDRYRHSAWRLAPRVFRLPRRSSRSTTRSLPPQYCPKPRLRSDDDDEAYKCNQSVASPDLFVWRHCVRYPVYVTLSATTAK